MTGRTRKLTAVLAAVGALAAGGVASAATGVGPAGGGGDDEGAAPPSSAEAQRASAAGLAAANGVRVNAVERDSENGATWEVEVAKADGSTVDVRLDAAYAVVVIEGDSGSDGVELPDQPGEQDDGSDGGG